MEWDDPTGIEGYRAAHLSAAITSIIRGVTAQAGARDMAKGNPNPSPGTRFGAGQPRNAGGKTKAHKRLEMEAAEMATKLRHAMISTMLDKLQDGTDAMQLMSADALRLMKDSEDRAHGTPKQSVDVDANVSGSIVTTVRLIAAQHDDSDD